MSSSSVFGEMVGIGGDSATISSFLENPTLSLIDLRFSLILVIILCATFGLDLQLGMGQSKRKFSHTNLNGVIWVLTL